MSQELTKSESSKKIMPNFADEAIHLSKFVKKAIPALRSAIYAAFKSDDWKGRFSSWGEFVESEEGLGMSQGSVSKMLKVEAYYVEKFGMNPEALTIDNEKLYMAIDLPGLPEQKVIKAETLTRQEIKDSLAENPDGSDCGHKVLIPKWKCKACDRFIDVN